jgi:predicted transcriptional regulator
MMMTKRIPQARRTQIQILLEILKAASCENSSKTRLAGKSGLSFQRFEGYFSLLLEKDLLEPLECDDGPILVYRVTDRGHAAKAALAEAQRLLGGPSDLEQLIVEPLLE